MGNSAFDEFLKAFNSVTPSSDSEASEEYSSVNESDASFDVLVKDVNEKIAQSPEKGVVLDTESLIKKLDKICSDDGSKNQIDVTPEPPAKETLPIPDSFADVPKIIDSLYDRDKKVYVPDRIIRKDEKIKEEEPPQVEPVKVEAEPEKEEEEKEEEEKEEEEKEEDEQKDKQSDPDSSSSIISPDKYYVEVTSANKITVRIEYKPKVEWKIESPAPMWEKLYEKKRALLNQCLVRGEINFDALEKELSEATVDIGSETFDKDEVLQQMQAVQAWRERVKQITVRVNTQYFLFKKFYSLLESYLANIHYVKPSIKQGGLVLEHLEDVGLYMARLDGLHESVKNTEDTLKACYDTLSRKITICMELKPREIYEKYENQVVNSISGLFDSITKGLHKKVTSVDVTEEKGIEEDYTETKKEYRMVLDRLPENAVSRRNIPTNVTIDWDDIR